MPSVTGSHHWYICTADNPVSFDNLSSFFSFLSPEKLRQFKTDWSSVPIVYLYLRRMSDYRAVNGAYCPLIRTRPPSRCVISVRHMRYLVSPSPTRYFRVCVSTLLPEGVFARIEVLASLDPQVTSSYMHVQSLSHWAPASIGPYSQAYLVRAVCSF